jgi:hypothetical protein
LSCGHEPTVPVNTLIIWFRLLSPISTRRIAYAWCSTLIVLAGSKTLPAWSDARTPPWTRLR